jgi:hypothetical protein
VRLADSKRYEKNTTEKALLLSSSPDLRFIPKMDPKQAPKVRPSMHISMFRLSRMILFRASFS